MGRAAAALQAAAPAVGENVILLGGEGVGVPPSASAHGDRLRGFFGRRNREGRGRRNRAISRLRRGLRHPGPHRPLVTVPRAWPRKPQPVGRQRLMGHGPAWSSGPGSTTNGYFTLNKKNGKC